MGPSLTTKQKVKTRAKFYNLVKERNLITFLEGVNDNHELAVVIAAVLDFTR